MKLVSQIELNPTDGEGVAAMGITRESLLVFLREELGFISDDVLDDDPLFSSGLLDSFSMVELLVFIEKQHNVRLSPTDVTLDNLDSISRILSFSGSIRET